LIYQNQKSGATWQVEARGAKKKKEETYGDKGG
jgi:hypothetical protein